MMHHALVYECDAEGCGEVKVVKYKEVFQAHEWVILDPPDEMSGKKPRRCVCPKHLKLKSETR